MILKKIEFESFAKINLHLDITGKLDNGFHKLFSVFQLIELSDRIKIRIKRTENTPDNERIIINGNFDCSTEDNLIYRIIKDFEKESGILFSYVIDVEKNIPDGGGLGGGSSDAAYVLYNINKINDFPLDNNQIMKIAEKNGSDIPFFLKAVTALVKGRGEEIYPVKADLTDFFLVLVCPDFKISTKDAYNLFDSRKSSEYESFELTVSEISQLLEKDPKEWGFFNSFTPVLTEENKVFEDIFLELNNSGCRYCNITGSGSAVYGIFSSIKDAENAVNKLKNKFPFVWNGKMLAGKPLLDK